MLSTWGDGPSPHAPSTSGTLCCCYSASLVPGMLPSMQRALSDHLLSEEFNEVSLCTCARMHPNRLPTLSIITFFFCILSNLGLITLSFPSRDLAPSPAGWEVGWGGGCLPPLNSGFIRANKTGWSEGQSHNETSPSSVQTSATIAPLWNKISKERELDGHN